MSVNFLSGSSGSALARKKENMAKLAIRIEAKMDRFVICYCFRLNG
jgi:hypothetical protein